jgi:hypothetical protein
MGEGALASEKQFQDLPTNLKGAYLTCKFKKVGEDIGKWHDGTYSYTADDVAFMIQCPQGSVIDLAFAFQLASSGTNGTALTTSSSSSGTICWNYLDNTSTGGSAGTSYLVPQNVLGTVASGF